ncbi:MAG TPA: rod shape-determining protein RodA [Bacillota bacterium]|nr:rod shape-determining protein RodA [Bacillota bacterium]
MLDRKLWRSFDWALYAAVLLVSFFGTLIIASASAGNEYASMPFWNAVIESLKNNGLVQKQLLWILIGQAVMLTVVLVDYQIWSGLTYPIYLGALGLLVIVLLVGSTGGGAQRWISLGGFGVLQPSELAKIAVIMVLAKGLEKIGRPDTLWKLFLVGLHIVPPAALIVIQPDLGTSLVFIAFTVTILLAAGLTPRLFALMSAAAIAATPVIWLRGLRDYQRSRLLVFLDPTKDPSGEGYHILQSIIAVGSGMFAGRGMFRGPQAQLNFLPAQHTDFVFSVVGEELGFVGVALLLIALSFIVLRIYRIAGIAKDDYGRLVSVGVATYFAFQILVNTGMTAGIMPITGLPLPLMSAGGSSYLATCIGVGLVLNIGMRRKKILF